jgi:PAS domain S-box-containing protein
MKEVQEALAYAEAIIATLREPFLVLDKGQTVRTANSAFYETFHVPKAETEGRPLSDIGGGQWNIPALRTLLEAATREAAVHDFEVEHDFPTIGQRTMLLNARRFPPEAEDPDLILLAIEDVTDRRRAELTVKLSELRFRRVFQTAKDGILILDAETGKIIDANPFMGGLLGYEHDEFVGKELWEIGLFEDEEESRAAYKKLREDGYIRYENLPLKAKSGREVQVEFVSNVYEEADRLVAQCNIRDITEHIRRMKENEAALVALHLRKDEFLAMLSHELRNPISPILNAMHLLRDQGDEDEGRREARSVIERQVGQLSRLVDDLLEVSRITEGKIHIRTVAVDMREIVGRSVESARPLFDRRRHILTVTMPSEPLMVEADPTRMEQVIVNLLNNAAKYTDEGGRVGLGIERDGEAAVLRVRDTGVGIAPDLLPHVFDLFTQADRSLDRSQGGLGVGLALVKRLVELHNGTVEARSDGIGRGSEFIVRLPVLSYTTSQAPAAPVPSSKPAARGWRVLVVDDNEDSAEMMAKLLKRTGHDVRTAYTGTAALDVAAAHQPDAVLLDIGLPEINGYEVARRLRLLPHLKDVKLVAMTGYGQDTDRQLAREAGFDSHLTKPVDFEKVQEVLTTLFESPGSVG